MNEKIFCGLTPEENARMRQYFNTLPTYVQETIHQAGMSISNITELKKCAENMTKNNN